MCEFEQMLPNSMYRKGVELMTNAEKIRQFDDEQLARFLWIWKVNSVTTFLTEGGMNSMDVEEMRAWLDQTTDTFICTETLVGDDFIFDQDFKDKHTPRTDCETCRYGRNKHKYAHICNECGVGINNYTPQTETSTNG